MDFKNLDLSEQEAAVHLFKQGLKNLAADLADVNIRYGIAQAAFKEIEDERNKVVGKYNTIISLITKAGGQVDENEANLANVDAPPLTKQDEIEHKEKGQKANLESSSLSTNARPVIRNEVIDILRTANKVLTANDVLSLIRKKLGDHIPDSTVTSALSVQYKAGLLKRYSTANGSNLYGLPEWFFEGKPKQEYSDNSQMLIMS